MSFARNMRDRLITADTTLGIEDDLIKIDTSSNSVAITLPSAAAFGLNRRINFSKQTGDQNTLAVTPGGSDKLNESNLSSFESTAPFVTLVLVSDGVDNWTLIGFSATPVVSSAQPGSLIAAETGFDSTGTLSDFTISGNSNAKGLDSAGIFRDLGSASGLNAEVGWEADGDIFQWDGSPEVISRQRVVSLTIVRFFTGIISGTLSNAVGADDPTQAHLGFRFSPDTAGDSFIQFVVDDGTTQVLSPSTVSPGATDLFTFVTRVFDDLNEGRLEIRDRSNALLDSHVFTTGLPAGGTQFRPVGGLKKTQASPAAAQELDVYDVKVLAVGS